MTLNNVCAKRMTWPIQASAWSARIVTPLKSDGKIPKIWGDYRSTLDPRLLRRTWATVEAEDILDRLHGPEMLMKFYLRDGHHRIPSGRSLSILTITNTYLGCSIITSFNLVQVVLHLYFKKWWILFVIFHVVLIIYLIFWHLILLNSVANKSHACEV